MKCRKCKSPVLFFTVMPDISNDVAWCSHVVSDIDGHCSLYHYQCAEVDPMEFYYLFAELIDEGKKPNHLK